MASTIVIFGASGDLTQRKLIPALFNLYRKGRLPDQFHVVGFALTELTDESFRAHLKEGMQNFAADDYDEKEWPDFAAKLYYMVGNVGDQADYIKLKTRLDEIEVEPAHRLFYLAVAPRFFPVVAEQLGAMGMQTQKEMGCRLVVEKPFGRDLESAQVLNKQLQAVFDESQIFRIDHFLGKETAQNLLFFRFANTLFELGWNRNYIDSVQITVNETVDVGHRGGYYDQAGVLRDMFQNHLLQLMALMAMEPPSSYTATAIHNEKRKVFDSLKPITPDMVAEQTVRGQYKGYRDRDGVDPKSETATFAALRVFIDNWRWQGVPFYLRSGKALDAKLTEINLRFREPPHVMFPLPPDMPITPNTLSICVQPGEGIHFNFEAKVPDTDEDIHTVDMNFHYEDDFPGIDIPDAYEYLLLDALEGNATLFTRSDGIEQAWAFIDPILKGWAGKEAPPLELYEPGSTGPEGSDAMLAKDGRMWLMGCVEH